MADNDSTIPTEPAPARHGIRRLARVVLLVFLLTFVLSRVVVFLIMDHLLPDLYMHMGGTHVHHLNYGIFLLVGVGAWLLFSPPEGKRLTICAVLYAIGLALTFDEFGMWLHLGGGYWQRASYDAVVIIAALLGLVVVAPTIKKFHAKHWFLGVLLLVLIAWFLWLVNDAIIHFDKRLGPKLQQLENQGPA